MLRVAFLFLAAPLSALVVPGAAVARPVRVGGVRMELSALEKKKAARRKSALQTGTNWPPRTDPIPGKGYLFFQGPTPKTSVQADLPSFFSAENFADLEVTGSLEAHTPRRCCLYLSWDGGIITFGCLVEYRDIYIILPTPTSASNHPAKCNRF